MNTRYDMNAMAQATRSRPATLVRKDAPWKRFALQGIERQCGRKSSQGGAT